MVQQLTKEERKALRSEIPGLAWMRVSIAIDAENQCSSEKRERVICWRVEQARWRRRSEELREEASS